MGLQLGFPFRLSRRTNLNYSQHWPQINPDLHIELTTLDLSVYLLLQVWHLVSVCIPLSQESPLPDLCFIYSPGFVSAKWCSFYPRPFICCQSHPSHRSAVGKKNQSFNCNFRAGSPVKEWCSFSCAVAVRHICHWQDYLRKNICQTHTRAAAENADSTVSVDVALGSVPWDSDG